MQTCLAVFLRGLLRWLGLTAYAKSVGLRLGLPGEDDLERVVDDSLSATIRPSDVVWGVGVNRGRQTRMLSRLVGRAGLVVSIEPEAANMGHLASDVWSAPNITLVNAALSDTDGTATLIVEGAEDRVLAGMAETLSSTTLKGVLIEVHLSALEQNGRAFAPVHLDRCMRSHGLETRWLTGRISSHAVPQRHQAIGDVGLLPQ